MQTHYIEVITRGETVEESEIHGSAEKEDTKDAGKDTEAT